MIPALLPEVPLNVRMMVPPIAFRRAIDQELALYFQNHRTAAFNRAIAKMCRYYNVRRPRVYWYEYLDWGKTAGKTYEDGRIHLVHPENWKRGRVYNSERMWVQAIYHEMGHYLFWTDAERKADAFTRRMVHGLRRTERRTRTSSRIRSSGVGRTVASNTASRTVAVVRSRIRARQRRKRKLAGGARKARRS